MVNYVPIIMQTMHKFTPEGQTLLLKVLRENRGVINKRYGFVRELPSVLIKTGAIDGLVKTCTVKGNLDEIFGSLLHFGLKVNPQSKAWEKALESFSERGSAIINKNISLINELSTGFETKKVQLIEFFKKKGLNGFAKKVKSSQTPEELAKIVTDGNDCMSQEALDKFLDLVRKSGIKNNRNGYSLEAMQEQTRLYGQCGDSILELQKIISVPSSNPEIVKLENIIKQEFGMDYVHFTTVEDAEKFLRAARIAKIEGLPLPKNVTSSSLMGSLAGGSNCFDSNMENIVFMKPVNDIDLTKQELEKAVQQIKNKKLKKYIKLSEDFQNSCGVSEEAMYSTLSELHMPMHEIVHCEIVGKRFPLQSCTKLSKEQVQVARSVSGYATQSANNITEEVRTEIRVKEILHKYFPSLVPDITPEQKKLMDFLS